MLTVKMEQELERVYTDPRHPGSYSAVKKLKKSLPGHVHVTIKKVQDWLKTKDTYVKHRFARKNFKRNQVVAPHIDAQWQGDLADMGNLARNNDGVRFLLILIDVVSKHAWVEPLKSKSAKEVLGAFQRIFAKTERKPLKLQTDDGTEFKNASMYQFFREHGITFFTVKSDKKAAVAERLVRTIKEKIWRYMTEKETSRYVDVLEDLVHSYNNTYHNSIKMAPSEVNFGNEGKVLRTLYGKEWMDEGNKVKKPKLKVGDMVKISRLKGVFNKAYMGNWTEELFLVEKVWERVPYPMYGLKDWSGDIIEGAFYEHELQKVERDLDGYWRVDYVVRRRTRQGRREVLVKWRGYPETMNSWIPADDIITLRNGRG